MIRNDKLGEQHLLGEELCNDEQNRQEKNSFKEIKAFIHYFHDSCIFKKFKISYNQYYVLI